MAPRTTYVREEQTFPFILRVIWFFLLGWHLTLYWIVIAWLLNLTIVGLPLGLWMLNRVPLVLTLRMSQATVVEVERGRAYRYSTDLPQPNFLVRVLYFILIGWWFSLLWSLLAWLFCITIIGLPLGTWMFNRLPNLTTLLNQ
ncbi:MAG TPA: YccF domain-containing protein [Anaerolineae bacterium]